METAYKHINDKPAAFGGPQPFSRSLERYQAVVFKALKKNPQDRYQSMLALRNDLELLATASDSDWSANAYAVRRTKRVDLAGISRRKVPWGIIALSLACCLVVGGIAVWAVAFLSDAESEDYPHLDNKLLWAVQHERVKDIPEDFASKRKELQEKLDLIEQSKTKDSSEYAETLKKLGVLNLKGGVWPEAAKQLRELIELQKKSPQGINLAEAYANLATCYFWQGDLNQAIDTSLSALKIAKRSNVKDLLAEANALSILGDIYTRNGDDTKAKETYLRLVGFWDNFKQRYPAQYALASAMLADCYRRQAHLSEAEQYYKNALDWWQNYVGHQDQFIAKALYGLGLVLKGEKRYDDARERFKRALPLAVRFTGRRGALVGAIKKESSDCLFHTNLLLWFNQKIKPEDEGIKPQELPPLKLPPA